MPEELCQVSPKSHYVSLALHLDPSLFDLCICHLLQSKKYERNTIGQSARLLGDDVKTLIEAQSASRSVLLHEKLEGRSLIQNPLSNRHFLPFPLRVPRQIDFYEYIS